MGQCVEWISTEWISQHARWPRVRPTRKKKHDNIKTFYYEPFQMQFVQYYAYTPTCNSFKNKVVVSRWVSVLSELPTSKSLNMRDGLEYILHTSKKTWQALKLADCEPRRIQLGQYARFIPFKKKVVYIYGRSSAGRIVCCLNCHGVNLSTMRNGYEHIPDARKIMASLIKRKRDRGFIL